MHVLVWKVSWRRPDRSNGPCSISSVVHQDPNTTSAMAIIIDKLNSGSESAHSSLLVMTKECEVQNKTGQEN